MAKYLLCEMCEVQKKFKRSMATGNISPGEQENILVIKHKSIFSTVFRVTTIEPWYDMV